MACCSRRDFPVEWNYWVGPAEGRGGKADRPRLDHLERLQLSLRREDGEAIAPEGYGVEVEWVALEFGGNSTARLRSTRDRAVEQLGGDPQIHHGPRLEQDLSGSERLPAPAGAGLEPD